MDQIGRFVYVCNIEHRQTNASRKVSVTNLQIAIRYAKQVALYILEFRQTRHAQAKQVLVFCVRFAFSLRLCHDLQVGCTLWLLA